MDMSSAAAGSSTLVEQPSSGANSSNGHLRKKHKKESSKHRSRSATLSNDGDESDAMTSASSQDRDQKPKGLKKRERRGSDVSFTSASETENEQADESEYAKRIRNRKGKGPAVSALITVQPTIDIPIPPALCQDPQRAAHELMDTLLIRYVPEFGGVLLRHEDITFTRQTGIIDGDGAFATAPATMHLQIWAPSVGMRLEGRVILSTPSHVSLLCHDKFNASITSPHLPSMKEKSSSSKDAAFEWHEFPPEELENGSANEEETVKDEQTSQADSKTEDFEDLTGVSQSQDLGEKSTGYWINTKTGEKLGGKDGKVVFTVVGLTIANHMLSVHGSLLRKPFSIPAPTYIPSAQSTASSSIGALASSTAAEQDVARRVRFQDGHQTSEFQAYKSDDSDDDDNDEVNANNNGAFASSNARAANVTQSAVVHPSEKSSSKKKKRSSTGKVGPRLEGEASGSESESDAKREKKKRKKAEK